MNAPAKAEAAAAPTTVTMDDIVALCKRRGFIFQASEIYGGLNGFWDFGPMGVLLKNNLQQAWWQDMVLCPPIGPDGHPISMVGLDSALIQNPNVWVASGHVAGFSDPMVDCRETKRRFRADHITVFIPPAGQKFNAYATTDELKDKVIKRLERETKTKADAWTQQALTSLPLTAYATIIAPEADAVGTLTEPRDFNLMFKTYVGAISSEDNMAYLRPETAQGIFTNFKNVCATSRVKVPFGIAQVGKAFRNEVTPRNYIFRSREFEQMEIEFFCHEKEAGLWYNFWKETRAKWWESLGVPKHMMQLRKHDADELSHYAKNGQGTTDIEFKFPFSGSGYGELEGIAHRSNFDLTQHQQHAKTKLEYFDDETSESFLPHVIEPSAGLTRGLLAVICSAYTLDASRPAGMFMNFHPRLAPIKAAILPLTAKDGLPELAEKIYMDLRRTFHVQLDIKQNIGKRYARQDEAGTPFCITIDHDSLNDQQVTIRNRNTQQQVRVAIASLSSWLTNALQNPLG